MPRTLEESFALARSSRKIELASWTGALLLHAPLLFWQGGGIKPEEAPQKMVEVSLASEEPPPQAAASAPEAPKAASAPAAPRNPFSGFRSLGPWGKAAAAKLARNVLHAGRDSGLSDIPSAWKPKAPQPAKMAGIGKGAEDDSPGIPEKSLSGLAPSPWAASSHGARAGGLKDREPAEDEGDITAGLGRGDGTGSSFQAGTEKETGGALKGMGGGEEGGRGSGEGGGLYELRGPLARRKVLHSTIPRYPDWALEAGLEADVTVRFVVLPDGTVKEPIVVTKTSGDPRLDELVVRNLKTWRFSRLSKGAKEEQWGLLTFHFRLRG